MSDSIEIIISRKLGITATVTKLDRACSNSRNTDCKHSKQCLDVAIKNKWLGFSCEKCELRHNKPRIKELSDPDGDSISTEVRILFDHSKTTT